MSTTRMARIGPQDGEAARQRRDAAKRREWRCDPKPQWPQPPGVFLPDARALRHFAWIRALATHQQTGAGLDLNRFSACRILPCASAHPLLSATDYIYCDDSLHSMTSNVTARTLHDRFVRATSTLEVSMSDRDRIWCDPDLAQSLSLPAREVHVWRARLSSSTSDLSKLRGFLSSEEWERADRFRSEHDRARFLLGRIVARSVLGHCLQRPARDIQLSLDHSGRPVVSSPAETLLNFNLSHSGDYVLLALARDRRVGVDVEQVRDAKDLNEIAARFFSKAEYSRLQTIPERLRTESFYRCWTLKEAYLKARGEGFRRSLDSFDVAFLPGEMPRLLETRFDPLDTARWCFRELDLGSSYLAALTTEAGPELELKLWDWNGRKANG